MPEQNRDINILTLRIKEKCSTKDDYVVIMAVTYAVNYHNKNMDESVFEQLVLSTWNELISISNLEGEIDVAEVIDYAKRYLINEA